MWNTTMIQLECEDTVAGKILQHRSGRNDYGQPARFGKGFGSGNRETSSKPCSKCDRPFYANGLCKQHYKKSRFAVDPKQREDAIRASREFRARDPEKVKLGVRSATLRGKYGITLEEYDRLLEAQGGICAICGTQPGKRRLCVDHNHSTGLVRGLLCFRCNYGLPWFRESQKNLTAAAAYVASPPAISVLGERTVPKKRKKSYTRKTGKAA
jgi:hypothetical protein